MLMTLWAGGENMKRELLVCTSCRRAVFVDSVTNNVPRWTGEVSDLRNKRKRIKGRDDPNVFKREHLRHEMIEVELAQN